ncbi:MAG: regulatory protein RecX [Muribaculaceae bacterium]
MISKKTTAISPEKALYKAATLCSRSEQCAADIRTKLTAWGVMPSDADAIIQRLERENYLNEERYARAFVRDKFRFGGWGKIKIAYALRLKRIDEAVIGEALEEISDDDYREALLDALRSKLRSVKGREPMQQRAALYRFAASRGYDSDLISRAVSTLLSSPF